MAARVTYYAASLSRTATTTTDYSVSKVTSSFLPSPNKTYAILWSAVLDGNDINYSQKVRIQRTDAAPTSVTLAEEIMDPRNVTIATSTTSAGGLSLYTAPASPVSQTLQMQFASSDAAMSCGIQEAKLFIIELIDGVDVWTSSVGEQTTTGGYIAKVTLSWTPATIGDYYTLASAEVQAGTAEVQNRLFIDGATVAGENANTDYNNPGNWQMYVAAYRHVALSAAAHTVRLDWGSVGGGAAPIRNAYAVSLRLSSFETAFWAENRTQLSSTSATYVNSAAVTDTPAAVRYLMVGCGNVDTATDVAYATSTGTRLAVDGVGQGTVYSQQPGFPDYYRNWFDIAVRTEAAVSTTWSTQYARTVGAVGARTDEHVLGIFQIDTAAGLAVGNITYIGAGTPTHGTYNTAANPPLPSGITAGDLLVCFSHLRSNGTLTSSWTTHASLNGGATYLLVSYRIATGADTAPTITPATTTSLQHHTSCVLAFRGVSVATPFLTAGTAAQYVSAEDVGPIAAATATVDDGAVIVFGARNDAVGGGTTNPALLTGDGLTWVEAVDAQSTDNASHIVVDYAIWEGAAPTLTAKTFDLPGGTTAAVSAGVMLLLNPSLVPLAYVGVGASSAGDHTTVLAPPIPAGVAVGDLLIAVGYLRNAGTLSISTGWIQHYTLDTTQNGSDFYLNVWYRYATGSDTAPTITITGGVTGPQSLTQSFVVAYRGVHTNTPFGTHGADSFNVSGTSVGPIAASSSLPDYGAALVLGIRNATAWTSVLTLTGDGLTWVEGFDNYTNTVSGVGISLVMDHAIWGGGAPTLTAKTYLPTGGVAGPGMGKMFILNAASITPSVTQTTQLSANAVVAVPVTTAISADAYVILSTGIVLGALATADHITNMVPALPVGLVAGDILVAFGYLRGSGFLSIINTDINAYPVVTPETAEVADAVAYSLGTRWFSDANGQVKGIRFYKGGTAGGNSHTVALYADDGTQLAVQATASETASGWQTVIFTTPVQVAANTAYKAVVHWPLGMYPATSGQFVAQFDAAPLHIYADGGQYAVGATIDNPTQMFNSNGYFSDVIFTSSVSPWIQHSLADLPQEIYLHTWFTVYDGSQVAPTITTTGGLVSPQTLSMSFIIAARGYNTASPFGADGLDSVNITQATIGPISIPSSLPSSGAVFVTGWRNGTPWTSVPTLTGDGLTWIELFDNYTHIVAGRNITGVIDYATWSGGAPALTAKTFAPVGGASAPALGKMFVLNAILSVTYSAIAYADAGVQTSRTTVISADAVVVAVTQSTVVSADVCAMLAGTFAAGVSSDAAILAARLATVSADTSISLIAVGNAALSVAVAVRVSPTITISADVNVALGTKSATVSADVSVLNSATKTLALSADTLVVFGLRTVSQLVFCDTVVIPPPSQEGVLSSVGELSAERTDTAWLVLLTLSHPDLPDPIRVTSDGVPTVSAGNVFSPFPFEIVLPDDVEGRPPQSQIVIDNTTQEIIAMLRGLTTPPKLTVQIVRSVNPDIVEYQWVGLEWGSSSYDKNTITGTLTFNDLTREEFPYETFDGRWQGLFSG